MQDCQINRWQQIKSQLNNLSPEAFRLAIQSDPDTVILDCRTPGEYAHSRIPGAVNFNYLTDRFVEQMETLDREKNYYVYCRSERRSLRTCILLQNGGFRKVYNLDGGLISWMAVFGDDSLDRM